MMERSLQTATASVNKMAVSRPTDLPNLQKDTDQSTQELLHKLYKNGEWPSLLVQPWWYCVLPHSDSQGNYKREKR